MFGAPLASTPDQRRVLCCAAHPDAGRLYDVASGQLVMTYQGHTDYIWQVAIDPEGRYALTASSDQTARIWDLDSGKELQTLRGHKGIVWSAAFRGGSSQAVTVGDDGTLRIWDRRASSS